MTTGVSTPDLTASPTVDSLVGNRAGNTVQIPISNLIALLGTLLGPAYQTRAQLYADLAWPDGAIGSVWGDATAAYNGVYLKSGASGAGAWARTGDLPQSTATAAQLAAKADVTLVNDLGARVGRVYSGQSDAIYSITKWPPPATVPLVLVWEGTALVVRNRTTPTEALFATGDPWGVLLRIDLTAEAAARQQAISAEAQARAAGDAAEQTARQALASEVSGPREVIPGGDGNAVLMQTSGGQVLVAWTPTGMLAPVSDEMIAAMKARLAVALGLGDAFVAPRGLDMVSLVQDAAGRTLIGWREDGMDAEPSAVFAQRVVAAAGLVGRQLDPTRLDVQTMQGQSLSVGGEWDVDRLAVTARAQPDAAWMLGGLRNTDAQLIGVEGPRSKAYDRSYPASGLVTAVAPVSAVTGAWPLAAVVNSYRHDLGLPEVPVLTTCHGIPGIPLADADFDPTTGTTTLIRDNLLWWHDEAKRVASAAGKTLVVTAHHLDHGTSSKDAPRGEYLALMWGYARDYRAMLAAKGIGGSPILYLAQPGGDANTSYTAGEPWWVRDEILQFCEAGGGVLSVVQHWYPIADNNVHPAARATILMAEARAWSVAATEAGRRWTIGRPRVTRAPGTITLHFADLWADEYLQAIDGAAKYGARTIDPWLGFDLVGGTITGIAVRGHTVTLTHSGAPTRVQYAYQALDATGIDGNAYVAPWGLLRTSQTRPSKLLPGEIVERPIPAFLIDLE